MTSEMTPKCFDLVLSSGFLAFARQVGFLGAIEEAGIAVGGICGTSSGALAGALWAAGVPAKHIGDLLKEPAPLRRVGLSRTPWRGLLDMAPAISILEDYLPERFEDLARPFSVCVMNPAGEAELLSKGDLRAAVMASCAIPWLFAPVEIRGIRYRDGGVVDRTGLGPWRRLRPNHPVILHLVERTHGGADQAMGQRVTIVRSPRSGARLWNLGPFDHQVTETREQALATLAAAGVGQ